MIIKRVWAMPNKWTFKIKPIAELLAKYVGDGKGWVDPFAGMNSPAEFTNDLNTESPAVSMFYKGIGLKSRLSQDPTAAFKYVRDKLADKIYPSGYVISFGWNSNGFGKKRNYEIVEILLVAHGGGHNDTIVTVEQHLTSFITGKINNSSIQNG